MGFLQVDAIKNESKELEPVYGGVKRDEINEMAKKISDEYDATLKLANEKQLANEKNNDKDK